MLSTASFIGKERIVLSESSHTSISIFVATLPNYFLVSRAWQSLFWNKYTNSSQDFNGYCTRHFVMYLCCIFFVCLFEHCCDANTCHSIGIVAISLHRFPLEVSILLRSGTDNYILETMWAEDIRKLLNTLLICSDLENFEIHAKINKNHLTRV